MIEKIPMLKEKKNVFSKTSKSKVQEVYRQISDNEEMAFRYIIVVLEENGSEKNLCIQCHKLN
jgi:hypothetical protein